MAPLTLQEFIEQSHLQKSAPKYNSAVEPKGSHRWWELDKTEVKRLLKELSQLVTNAMKGTPESDKELKHISNTAIKLGNVEPSPPIKVALIGAQGAGKSLLINALFDYDGLSLTGADGAACTSSIVKYADYPDGDNANAEKNFVAKVKFLDTTKREQMIGEHVQSYAYYNNDIVDSDDEDEPGNTNSTQDELDRRRKDTAEDVFHTLFGSREQFLESWASSGSRPGEFSCLCSLKCDEALKNLGVSGKGVKAFSHSNQHDLVQELRPFLTKVKGEVCLWPLVDCVTIHFANDLLRQGLEIIDLPGSGDTNLSRARHTDDVKDSVDVEIILADTIRITTDDAVINTARAGVKNHGASKVKVVATKIDAISDNQLAQCTGKPYDHIKNLLQTADEEAAQADEEEDETKLGQIGKYKTYLERCLKAQKIIERKKDISLELDTKFDGRTPKEKPEFYHISAADYMKWIAKEKIMFRDQPALSPELTGIPAIRKFLSNLPAQQNLRDYTLHLEEVVPAFIDKVDRVVTQFDRDEGFKTIADAFDFACDRFMTDFTYQAKKSIQSFYCLNKIQASSNSYKKNIEVKLQKQWLTLKGPTFNKILRARGVVEKGTSRAKGLELGCNWNQELADILAPGFRRWHAASVEAMEVLKDALLPAFDVLHNNTLTVIRESAANLVTVEKARLKWAPMRHHMQTKIIRLMEKVTAKHSRLLHRATKVVEADNNLIAAITDGLYNEVFHSAPPLKDTPPGKPKRYITPKLKFQKKKMEDLFLKPQDHVVDRIHKEFQEQLDATIMSLFERTFSECYEMFANYSKGLRDHAPIDYTIYPQGEDIRKELEKLIPELRNRADELRALLPTTIKQEHNTAMLTSDSCDESKALAQGLDYYLEIMVKKRKRTRDDYTRNMRSKKEAETKKIKY